MYLMDKTRRGSFSGKNKWLCWQFWTKSWKLDKIITHRCIPAVFHLPLSRSNSRLLPWYRVCFPLGFLSYCLIGCERWNFYQSAIGFDNQACDDLSKCTKLMLFSHYNDQFFFSFLWSILDTTLNNMSSLAIQQGGWSIDVLEMV